MKREIIRTGDGSATIFLPEWNEHYHSKHGALQEAYHVFIKTGLDFYRSREDAASEISILEIGFGTGLNALITLLETQADAARIAYTGIEAYPVSKEELKELDYAALFSEPEAQIFLERMHEAAWEKPLEIAPGFELLKKQLFFSEITDVASYNLIYFDAFGPRVQPDLWTEDIFKKMHTALKEEGILVTYSAKGSVRRAMESVGFRVERLPGPPGKREMLRAVKTGI